MTEATLTPASAFDVEGFRAHFPPLQGMTHLGSCSQGALSTELTAALGDMTQSLYDNGAPWAEWMTKVEELRQEFATLINTTPEHIAIVPSASAGSYQVVSSFDWSSGNLVTSAIEFPSTGQVHHAQMPNGAKVKFIADQAAALTAPAWLAQIDEDTKLISVPLVSYHDGAMPDLRSILAEARKRGVVTFVDAYQGAGVVPLDVAELGCDYLVSGSLKYLLGLGGAAFLYVRDIAQAERAPEFTGWFGRVNPFGFDPQDTSVPDAARKYEGGTPAIPAIYASLAGVRLINGIDQAAGWAWVKELRAYLCDRLTELGLDISQPADPQRWGPQVSARFGDPDAVAAELAKDKIVTAPRNDLLRISLHYYSTRADVDRIVEALGRIRG